MGHHRVLTVNLPLGQDLHQLLDAALASNGDAAEAFALTVGAVFVELDLDKVRYSNVVDRVLDVLIFGPPGQVLCKKKAIKF